MIRRVQIKVAFTILFNALRIIPEDLLHLSFHSNPFINLRLCTLLRRLPIIPKRTPPFAINPNHIFPLLRKARINLILIMIIFIPLLIFKELITYLIPFQVSF